jgi:hypothetical protein
METQPGAQVNTLCTSDSTPRQPRRQWTERLSEVLGVNRRRVQEWRQDPTFPNPDQPDDQVAADWIAFERRIRSWLAHRFPLASAGCREPAPEIRPIPVWSAAGGAPRASGEPSLSGIPRPSAHAAPTEHAAWADAESALAKAERAKLDLRTALGEVIHRDAIGPYVLATKDAVRAALDSLFIELRGLIPLEAQTAHRDAINRALALARSLADDRLQAAYQTHLMPRKTP